MAASITFRTAPSTYFVVVGLLSLPAMLLIFAMIRNHHFEPIASIASLAFPGVWALGLSRFRLDFDETSFTYRSPFDRVRSAKYADIISLGNARSGPVSRRPIVVSVRLRGGSTMLVNLKPFPIEALQTLSRVLPSGSNKSLERTRAR